MQTESSAFGNFKESIMCDVGHFMERVKRAAARATDYRFYDPWQRAELKAEDIERDEEMLRIRIKKAESQAYSSMAGLPDKEQRAITRSIDRLKYRYLFGEISGDNYALSLQEQKDWIERNIRVEKRNLAVVKTQLKQQEEYAKLLIQTSKENRSLTGIKAQAERARARLETAQANKEFSSMPRSDVFSNLSDFMIK